MTKHVRIKSSSKNETKSKRTTLEPRRARKKEKEEEEQKEKKKIPVNFQQRHVSMHRDDIVNTRVSLCATAIVDFSSACDLFEKMRTRGRQVRGRAREKGSGVSTCSSSENSTPLEG